MSVLEGQLNSPLKLRLLLFEECNRSCEGCCNKQFNLSILPVVTAYEPYDMVMLTGGEPMLNPQLVIDTCREIGDTSDAKIVLYTARVTRKYELMTILLQYLDGLTLTLHEQRDVKPFIQLNELVQDMTLDVWRSKSLRLNVFKGVDLTGVNIAAWNVKADMQWIEDCPLPDGEVLMRLA